MKMPTIFVGHGNPMIALEDNEITQNFRKLGDYIKEQYKDEIKGILCISAHWYSRDNLVNNEENPKQIYDMYGFREDLYEVKYIVLGNPELANLLVKETDGLIKVNNQWGIDHGTWTVLTHMFPKADIPLVQLSVNADLSPNEAYEIGKKISFLRGIGYVIIGSGNIVHNLSKVKWDNNGGTAETIEFDSFIKEKVINREDESILNYKEHKDSKYAVPTKDHFYPFIYILGASLKEIPKIFNNSYDLGSISMTSYVFDDNLDGNLF